MTPEEANAAIREGLAKLGTPESTSEGYFLDLRFASINWAPTYCMRLGTKNWAIEIYRGDRIPEATISAMEQMIAVDSNVQPAFFVPEGERYEHLLEHCRQRGIALIAKAADEYDVIRFPSPSGLGAWPLVRIPEWIIERMDALQNLNPTFLSMIKRFGRRYRVLIDSGSVNDENQEALLAKTFLGFLKSDSRFAGAYEPLDMLRFFERTILNKGRDHYFHTFSNFLLGLVVIDGFHVEFDQFRRECFPGAQNWSTEYIWLLTVLFHDVGYPIQEHSQISEMVFGVPVVTEEQASQERKQAWDSPLYRISRAQLVALYDHLTQGTIEEDWSADPFPLQNHPLDRAFALSYLKHGHGVASSMRMLADFFRAIPSSANQRRFLARHIFLAGLSIPMHDWPVRKFLRAEGIETIRTCRFPFASLLMFVDSIQEDRRSATLTPDLLADLRVENKTALAVMNLSKLSDEKLREKKREVQDVKAFLTEDLLRFQYPPELF